MIIEGNQLTGPIPDYYHDLPNLVVRMLFKEQLSCFCRLSLHLIVCIIILSSRGSRDTGQALFSLFKMDEIFQLQFSQHTNTRPQTQGKWKQGTHQLHVASVQKHGLKVSCPHTLQSSVLYGIFRTCRHFERWDGSTAATAQYVMRTHDSRNAQVECARNTLPTSCTSQNSDLYRNRFSPTASAPLVQ